MRPPTRWLEWFLVESAPKLQLFQPRELANTAWALATLDHRPSEAWMARLLDSCTPRLGAFQPREMVAVLWALARLNYHPGEAWLCSFFAASYPLLRRFRTDELTAAARALCKLHAAPDTAWVEELTVAVQSQVGRLDAAGADAAIRAIRDLRAVAAAAEVAGRASTVPLLPPQACTNGGEGEWAGASSMAPPQLRHSTLPPMCQPAGLPCLPGDELQLAARPAVGSSLSWLESFMAEVHGVAALMTLMPSWMQQRLRQWPRAWAAQRLSRRGMDGSNTVVDTRGPQERLLR